MDNTTTQFGVFGGGCFWGIEDTFQKIEGVIDAQSGYAGGHIDSPSYEQVCTGDTGHAEVVKVTYDPSVLSYEQLVRAFFEMHDPTQMDRQGPDIGRQYRSVIFYVDDAQKDVAQKVKKELEQNQTFSQPIATAIEPLETFWPAEDYHQDYVQKHGGVKVC